MEYTVVPAAPWHATSHLGRLCGYREVAAWVSPASVAPAHGASAPQQRRWQLQASQAAPRRLTGGAVPVPVTAAACAIAGRAIARRRLGGQLPLGLRRHGLSGTLQGAPPAAEAEAGSTEAARATAWAAALAYLLLSLLHRRALRAAALSGAAPVPLSLVAALHAAAFLPAAFVQQRRSGFEGISLALVAAVVAAEVLSWMTLGRLAAAGNLGLTVALLSGIAIPYTMVLSTALLKRRFTPLAWAGALLAAVGVGCCGLGPLTRVAGAAQVAVVVGALAVPGLALVGREALVTGSRPLGIAGAAFLMSVAQLAASVAMPAPGAPSLPAAAALLWSPGAGVLWLYVLASGALRLSLTWALRESSAPTVQLLNALAVPLGAVAVTSGSTRNLSALLLACAGAALFLGARLGSPLMSAGAGEEDQAEAAPVDARKSLQMAFMEEMKAAGMQERKRTEKEKRQAARLMRLKERWERQDAEQRKKEGAQMGMAAPQMFTEDEEEEEGPAAGAGQPAAAAEDDAPLTQEELERIEMDEAYLGMMWKKWMVEHPGEWRREEKAAKRAREESR